MINYFIPGGNRAPPVERSRFSKSGGSAGTSGLFHHIRRSCSETALYRRPLHQRATPPSQRIDRPEIHTRNSTLRRGNTNQGRLPPTPHSQRDPFQQLKYLLMSLLARYLLSRPIPSPPDSPQSVPRAIPQARQEETIRRLPDYGSERRRVPPRQEPGATLLP